MGRIFKLEVGIRKALQREWHVKSGVTRKRQNRWICIDYDVGVRKY